MAREMKKANIAHRFNDVSNQLLGGGLIAPFRRTREDFLI